MQPGAESGVVSPLIIILNSYFSTRESFPLQANERELLVYFENLAIRLFWPTAQTHRRP
jgi:hypothetical protein